MLFPEIGETQMGFVAPNVFFQIPVQANRAKLREHGVFGSQFLGRADQHIVLGGKLATDSPPSAFMSETIIFAPSAAMRMERDWRELLDRWGADSVIMRRAWPIANALDAADDFEKLFDDGVIAYYRRGESN
jgi:hypothetical protein